MEHHSPADRSRGLEREQAGKGAAKATAKRASKDAANPKSSPTAAGSRFQCPRCPKNFSRIENLTRHQANHDDVGKFACAICGKRFTRSDLLNRHRRIHGPQPESKPHVTGAQFSGQTLPVQPGFENLGHHNDPRSVTQNGGGSVASGQSPSGVYQNHIQQPQGLYLDQHQNPSGYQQSYNASAHHPTMLQGPPEAQRLTSLMEAALAPQETVPFTPVENINPALWDGFMTVGESTSSYMGSYDADMSWTLDCLSSESSPSYLLDSDMMNAFDDFSNNSYQFQSLPYGQQAMTDADAEAEDDDTGDWPDKIGRPVTPPRHTPRVVPQLLPISWQPVIDEARTTGYSASTIRPFQSVNHALREVLLSSLNGNNFRNEFSKPEISDSMFPPTEALDFFLRLYVRYIQPRFPVLHLPTFDIYNSPPLLLLAMMFLGSSHSAIDCGRFSRLFYEHLRVAVLGLHELDKKYLRSVDNILTYFLLCLAGTWSGSKHSYEFSEGGRGILVTAGRRCRLLDCRPSSRVEIETYLRPGISHLQASWLAWVETEKRKRLGLSIYIYDCQYPTLFNNQPYVSKAETTNCVFPCAEEYFEACSAEDWRMLLGPAESPPCAYYLHALNCCLLRKWVKPPPPIAKTGEFGKTVLMYALHTHIFEWRQSTSMLNPTGLMGAFGNSAHDMGEGLRERRRWLRDGLDSFAECYQSPSTSAATNLLHHLGYVSLDVSLSDMHLVAGRSVHQHDARFAEENLKHWANSTISLGTMDHVFQMLEVCYNQIRMGTAADCSFEVAVSLFTGGMVCWAFAKLRRWDTDGDAAMGLGKGEYVEQVRRASSALGGMGCWRLCGMFGRILNGFDVSKSG